MQEIHIQAFGNLTDILGKETFILKEMSTTSQLIEQLEHLYPNLKGLSYRISLNNRLISETETLKDKDKIALLPPFSGG